MEPVNGAWSCPTVLVKEKYGKWRFCIDYTQNLDALAGSEYFSTLDLINGY